MDKKKKRDDRMTDLKKELEVDVHKIPVEEVYRRFGTNPATGLTPAQVKASQEKHGLNCLTPPPTTPEWVKFLKNLFGDLLSYSGLEPSSVSLPTSSRQQPWSSHRTTTCTSASS